MSHSRVSEIRHVAYGVVDLEVERLFYTETWGLEETAASDGRVWFRTPGHDEPFVVKLRQAAANRVDLIALAAATPADVEALAQQVAASGARLIHGPRALTSPGGGYGFRFFSPDGLPFEISCDVARGPQRELGHWDALPRRISHIVLHSPDHQALVRFFTDVLGFRISDWLGDFMCFLRCNSAHHRIAILPGPPCLNHVAYDVPSVDSMMRGIQRLRDQGTNISWGPGRHTAGNNTFSYFVTPNGFAVEYTADLDTVDDDRHVATVHVPNKQVMDQWGIGTGGPHTMPHPKPDAGLFQPVED